MDATEHFEDAAAWLSSTPAAANLSNDSKLEIYGLYKVATVGPEPDCPAPSFFSLPATKAKWNAWKAQGEKYGEDAQGAKEKYIEISEEIGYQVGKTSKGGVGGVVVSSMSRTDMDSEEELHEPVHARAMDGDIQALTDILKSDGDLINSQDEFGMSPLHYAADRGHVDTVRMLLDKGADRSLQDSEGLTPFQLAEPMQNERVLNLLRP
ncbi:hypothetical protein FFLO_01470 [Filobasidium floriforme]|uniref:ACB domain-containing protein n=1 Tax=Filobasidium floriforme TaxID=5210 RepID=A0A8K0JR00_9TREE|nr:acyl CoA binding protein-domain-containing protein [Filobasidium floriforme]KAG7563038.1 hypothetical protein FFLO_01470 [Filobasidium floriforme]KAH8089589.1 acyl CoA binding protein-domain-containing protein [Filobasidium floriforme]